MVPVRRMPRTWEPARGRAGTACRYLRYHVHRSVLMMGPVTHYWPRTVSVARMRGARPPFFPPIDAERVLHDGQCAMDLGLFLYNRHYGIYINYGLVIKG